MGSVVERLRDELVENVYGTELLDRIMEENKYYPVESDDDMEEGILKYSNQKSQIWLYYVYDGMEYLITNVTRRTKKRGLNRVHALRDGNLIKKYMDYYREHEMYDDFLTFMLEMLLARRIGDTLSLKWSDFYEENGNRKTTLKTLIEEKTDKIVEISVTDITWSYIDFYIEKTGIDPLNPPHNDIFWGKDKEKLTKDSTKADYAKAIDKMAAKFRSRFKKISNEFGVQSVSTHSLRKTFGYLAHLINRHDPDCLQVLQTIFGHDSVETTKTYIDVMAEEAEKMFYSVGRYVQDVDNGIDPCLNNMPIIVTRTDELQALLLRAYNDGMKNANNGVAENLSAMNQLYTELEKLRIK